MTQARDLADGKFDTDTLAVDSTNNRVGIGTTSPSGKLNLATGASSACELRLTSNNTGSGAGDRGRIVVYSSRNDGTAYEAGKIEIDRSSGTADQAHMIFATNTGSGNTEHMRIDANGTLIVNDTSAILGCPMHLTYDGANEQGLCIENIANSTSGAAIRFIDHAGSFSSGGIYFATSNSILYSTTSDYRLKENVTADWDATTRLKQLNPVRFNFISDAATTVDGFLAHEVQTVVPEAIIGTHNAVETQTQRQIDNGEAPDGTSAGDNKLDEDGNTIPMYQGIDQSKLVPLLVKTIQELEARIVALENA